MSDYIGTGVFAISGCLTAATVGMDMLGCTIVGTITAIGGGTFRDAIILHKQPFWIEEYEYFLLASGLALASFFLWRGIPSGNMVKDAEGGEGELLWYGDALGVGAFTVIGCQNAMRMGVHPVICVVCGMVTATFGGLTRDVLCGLPEETKGSGRILHSKRELYAITALIGSSSYVLAKSLPPFVRIPLGVGTALGSRILASKYDLKLPEWNSKK